MERLGGYLIFFAIGSAVLSQTNYQFRLMSWMNEMGNGAWALRALMLVVGVAMIASGQFAKRPAPAQGVVNHAPQAPQNQPLLQNQPLPAQAVNPQPAPAQITEF